MAENILALVTRISTPGFFVITDIIQSSIEDPEGIEDFVLQKLTKIQEGATGRKFAFRKNGWQINFTFFPTNQVVDKHYALMNKMIKVKKKIP
ncbi:hypothetical protein [uncultured Bacteroides sp.]|uniref:hypothetical protein n=1 Tax=uncultured Bacteroides sp. TaxID=162156 RepID=UPI002AAAD66C|nr:hypothetical protein [uncultured Bacteroides sp.]